MHSTKVTVAFEEMSAHYCHNFGMLHAAYHKYYLEPFGSNGNRI